MDWADPQWGQLEDMGTGQGLTRGQQQGAGLEFRVCPLQNKQEWPSCAQESNSLLPTVTLTLWENHRATVERLASGDWALLFLEKPLGIKESNVSLVISVYKGDGPLFLYLILENRTNGLCLSSIMMSNFYFVLFHIAYSLFICISF